MGFISNPAAPAFVCGMGWETSLWESDSGRWCIHGVVMYFVTSVVEDVCKCPLVWVGGVSVRRRTSG